MMPQNLSLLSLVFMISYVLIFDRIRWQNRHAGQASASSNTSAANWGYRCSGHPFRK